MAVRRGKAPLLILVLLILLAITHTIWLTALGRYLVRAEEPAPADYAVVLAGDYTGNRILVGGELVRRGLVRKALIDGSGTAYGVSECDLAVNFAARQGYPADYFIKLPFTVTSTRGEAREAIGKLRSLGAHSFLLVTSDYHTRRAANYFRPLAGDLKMRVVAAPDQHFHADSWWRDREGQKVFYMEWSKTVTSWFGI